MKILVTGGAGFIGSNYIYYLLKHHPEDEIICVDKLTYAGNLSTLAKALEHENVHFCKADIANADQMEEIFAKYKPDAVVNFAAESHVDRSIEDPGIFITTNVMGTQVLMDLARKYHTARFHQVSTDEVYGDLPLERKDLLFDEECPIRPSSPYAASKAAADLLVQAYMRTYDFPATISRCSNNYGPWHFPEKLIPLTILNALEDKPLPVYGTGANVRDWLYVQDHCAAIDLIVRNGNVKEVYNIGGHNEKTNLEIVKAILQALDKTEDLITFVKDRKGHDLRYAINPAKIQRELGWQPETDFETGLQTTIAWYLEHPSWWQDILSGQYQDYYDHMYGTRLKEAGQ